MKRGAIDWIGNSLDLDQQNFYNEFSNKAKKTSEELFRKLSAEFKEKEEDDENTKDLVSKKIEVIRITKDEEQKEYDDKNWKGFIDLH